MKFSKAKMLFKKFNYVSELFISAGANGKRRLMRCIKHTLTDRCTDKTSHRLVIIKISQSLNYFP